MKRSISMILLIILMIFIILSIIEFSTVTELTTSEEYNNFSTTNTDNLHKSSNYQSIKKESKYTYDDYSYKNDTYISGEIRCWYCSKVIYNNGRAIHCTHDYSNTYICDYCGTSNVIK